MELKPCPFCGGNASNDDDWTFCVDCGVGFESGASKRMWNVRISESKLQARLEAAEGALCEIEDIMPPKVTLPLTVSIKSIVDDWRRANDLIEAIRCCIGKEQSC